MTKKQATEVTGCKKCNKGFNKTQIGILFISGYVLISSIYGTIMFIKLLMNLF
jgi:hypothetical protein